MHDHTCSWIAITYVPEALKHFQELDLIVPTIMNIVIM